MSDFVAWLPEADTLAALDALCAALPASLPELPALRFRQAAQFHMTLRFLAEGLAPDPAPLYAALAETAAQTPRLDLCFDRLETWPAANALVARAAPNAALAALLERVERAARDCGHAGSPRVPAPHITLAYAAPQACLPLLPATARRPPPLPIAACMGSIALARTAPGRYDSLQWWPLCEPGRPLSMHLD